MHGRLAHIEMDQTIAGATADFGATKYALNATLAGRFNVKRFLVEPELSANWQHIDGHGFTTSTAVTVPGASTNAARLRAGARVSTVVVPSASLPPLAPFVSAYLNWYDFDASTSGGADIDGFSVSLATGVDVPIGSDGTLSFTVRAGNLFGKSGETIGGSAKFFTRW